MFTKIVRVYLIDPRALHVSQHIAIPARQWAQVSAGNVSPVLPPAGKAKGEKQ